MDILGILLLLVIVVICYKMYFDFQNKQIDRENFAYTPFSTPFNVPLNTQSNNIKKKKKRCTPKYTIKNTTKDVEKYLDKMIDFNKDNKNISIKEEKINPYFQEIQFHQDYRDTMNGFVKLSDQKNVFNTINEPLIKVDEPNIEEVSQLVDMFIQSLNSIVTNEVGDIAAEKLNSWQDNMQPITPDNSIIKKKASWEEYNEELGLPPTIYPESAIKAKVSLIKIDNINKYETLKELKYCVYLILQKNNVTDQMVVKVSFVIDKSDVDLEREFFDKNKNNCETKIIIEEISIIGFMIRTGFGQPKTQRQKFYDYDGFTDGRTISEKDVIKQLNDKKREIEKNFIAHM